jgi:hypothetical protein
VNAVAYPVSAEVVELRASDLLDRPAPPPPPREPRCLTVAGKVFHLVPPPVPEYVTSSWCASYRRIASHHMPVGLWGEGQRRIIRDLAPQTLALVAPAAPHTIQAWVCASPGVLHYVFVGLELRRLGIAKALVEATAGRTGHFTHHKPKELAKAFAGFTFNPYALTDAVRRAQTRRP